MDFTYIRFRFGSTAVTTILQFKKFKDQRVKFKQHVMKDGEIVQYPELGFPVDVLVVNQHTNYAFLTNESCMPGEFFF